MKSLLLAIFLSISLVFSPTLVVADQYGDDDGEVLGEQVDEQPEHEVVDAGLADMQLWQVIVLTGVLAFLSTALYKASYRLYIFDR